MEHHALTTTWTDLDDWYRAHARPVFSTWDPTRVPSLDAARDRLARLAGLLDSKFKVCILGKAGVGKSTLLNALLDEKQTILPQGGVGPLTAQAIVVQHATEAYLDVEYHGRRKLNQLLFIIQQQAAAEFGQGHEASFAEVEAELKAELDDEAMRAVRLASQPPDADGADGARNSFVQQARLLVQGGQFETRGDVRYLVDGLRACLGLSLVYGSTLTAEDQGRVEVIRGVLPPRSSKRGPVGVVHRRVDRSSPSFQHELRLHAAGSLAPLVNKLEVGWPAPVLASGATLVDLPGVGIANDDYQTVTRHHVKSSRAIGIVVDRAGIDAASAELLHETGFLSSLLLESGDEVPEPVHLFIAVVKLDMTADDRCNDAMNEGLEVSWQACFDEARGEAIVMLKNQLGHELAKLVDDAGAAVRPAMRAIVDRLLGVVEVFPVAATEYKKFHRGNHPRITDPGQSYIPQLGEAIAGAARQRAERMSTAFAGDLATFRTSLGAAVSVLEARVHEDTRADAEVRALREDFERFSAPLGKELVARKAAFREFLKQAVPAEIQAAVMEATDEVQEQLRRHLLKYRGYPWQTLRATIRRGGAFVGARTVDLPMELTLKFEDPITLLWSKTILSNLRRRTRDLANDNVRIGDQVVAWTRAQSGPRVPPRIAELLEDDLRTDVSQLASVGKDAIEELKERVKHTLFEVSQRRIRQACEEFVNNQQDVGLGVKQRMHEFFESELPARLIKATRPAALKVLTDSYDAVQAEVVDALKTLVDPVARANELVVERHASAILKRNQDERERLGAALAHLRLPVAR
jgi:hypothetical protein